LRKPLWFAVLCTKHCAQVYILYNLMPLTQIVQATIITYHRLDGLNNRHVVLAILEAGNPEFSRFDFPRRCSY
jgi:hypothetical protein